jgi:serine/threonine protein kinase
MEFVRGRTLEQLLDDGKRFTVDEILNIGRELCLAAVHAGAHRDIKAQNVVLAETSGRADDLGTDAGRP